ncbi:caspase family protein [Patescibacteria group bacterium]|nr:caspase family protein [Patescibacteria group bacterium]
MALDIKPEPKPLPKQNSKDVQKPPVAKKVPATSEFVPSAYLKKDSKLPSTKPTSTVVSKAAGPSLQAKKSDPQVTSSKKPNQKPGTSIVASSSSTSSSSTKTGVTETTVDVRKALIICISYEGEKNPLPGTLADGRNIQKALQKVGFQTKLVANPTSLSFHQALDHFIRNSISDESIFIYYAGHGYMDAGKTYLIPAKVEHKEHHISLEDHILRHLNRRSGKNILMLDSCRYNAADGTFRGPKPPPPAPTPILPPCDPSFRAEFLMMFASDPGLEAGEDHRGGYFTQSLLPNLKKGVNLSDLGMETNKIMFEKFNKQRPWVQSTLMTPFIF